MRVMLTSALALVLSGCGGGDGAETGADQAAAAAPNAEAVETAAGGGTAGERGIDCAAVKSRAIPGADILGVALTMPGDEAFDRLACAAPDMVVETQTAVDGSRSFLAQNGVENISVRLAGPLGDDRVIEINRTSRPASGDAPAIAGLMEQLTQKYGPFVQTQDGGMIAYAHVKSVDGRVAGQGDPLIDGCLYGEDPKCGPMVTVNLYPAAQNRGLAESFQVIANDKAYAKRQWDAFKASSQQAAQQRQAEEIEAAAGKKTAL